MPNPSRSELCHCAAPHASCSIAHRKRKLNGGKILTSNQNNAGIRWKREGSKPSARHSKPDHRGDRPLKQATPRGRRGRYCAIGGTLPRYASPSRPNHVTRGETGGKICVGALSDNRNW